MVCGGRVRHAWDLKAAICWRRSSGKRQGSGSCVKSKGAMRPSIHGRPRLAVPPHPTKGSAAGGRAGMDRSIDPIIMAKKGVRRSGRAGTVCRCCCYCCCRRLDQIRPMKARGPAPRPGATSLMQAAPRASLPLRIESGAARRCPTRDHQHHGRHQLAVKDVMVLVVSVSRELCWLGGGWPQDTHRTHTSHPTDGSWRGVGERGTYPCGLMRWTDGSGGGGGGPRCWIDGTQRRDAPVGALCVWLCVGVGAVQSCSRATSFKSSYHRSRSVSASCRSRLAIDRCSFHARAALACPFQAAHRPQHQSIHAHTHTQEPKQASIEPAVVVRCCSLLLLLLLLLVLLTRASKRSATDYVDAVATSPLAPVDSTTSQQAARRQ